MSNHQENNMTTKSTWRIAAAAAAVSLALSACEGGLNPFAKSASAPAGQQGGGRQMPAPTVSVVTVQPATITMEADLPGRLEAVRSAPIIPQVSGIVKRRLFQEGTLVKAGQPLYQLDDAAYAANLESARASLATAQAALAKADADVARYRPLVAADALSKQEWDAAVAAQRSAAAQVKAANAAIRAAQVNVNHAHITSPISGIIGQSLVTEGALVTANNTQMALVTENDYLYVNIKQSAGDLLKLRQQIMSGERIAADSVEVDIELEDGTPYPHKGRLLFADSTVDASNGQVTIRAVVPNPEHLLMNGLYVRVKLPLSAIDNAFAVPQQAVTRGTPDIVMVVNAQGGMEPRPVKIAGQKGENWVVTEGLKAGDKVIVEGIMIAGITGAKTVQTKEWQPEKQSAPAAQPAAASSASGVQAASAPAGAASEASAPAPASAVQAASSAASAAK